VDTEKYRIGELARKAKVTPRTVRYYETLGLLKTKERKNGNQRYYTDEDLVYLNRILQLKKYGMTLEEISEIIRLGNEDDSGERRRLELLKNYRKLLSKELQHLKDVGNLIRELQWHVKQLESATAGFKQCPGTACPRCEYKNRCEFYRDSSSDRR